MTVETEHSAVETRRRRLRFRAWHRGTKEMDLILGTFADAHAPEMDMAEIEAFEALMEAPEQDAYAWITGKKAVPDAFDTPLMARLRAHRVPTRTRLER